jgi:choline dehydrogenase-like flavoprotein
LQNLSVLSTSVFPAGGGANPTLTLMLFALRLGDRLTMSDPGRPLHNGAVVGEAR